MTSIEGGYVAYDPSADQLHELNPLGALLAELCDGSRTMSDIRALIAPLLPTDARYDSVLHEFVLPYDAMREADHPDDTLLAFLQSTYEAAANLARWDRNALEAAPANW